MTPQHDVTGLILAGGQGRRMGGRDKGLEPLAGRPLVAHVLDRLAGQLAGVMINANRHLDRYADYGDRLITDLEGGYQGPLMGIYSGLRAADTPWVLVVPCDTPALPMDLVPRLVAGLNDCDIAVAHDGERLHPVVALLRTRWPTTWARPWPRASARSTAGMPVMPGVRCRFTTVPKRSSTSIPTVTSSASRRARTRSAAPDECRDRCATGF